MINRRIFDATKEMEVLSKQYEDKAFAASGELKEVYNQFVNTLDDLHSKILGIAKYTDQEELNIVGVVTKSFDNLPSYSQVIILFKYENGYALVTDTAGDLHLISLEFIKVAD